MTESKPGFTFFTSLRQSLSARELLGAPLTAAGLLLIVTLLSYGLVIPRLGFYWDSWGMNWIAQTRGPAGLAQYFSTNRPVWGLLYQLTLPALGGSPLPWQIFGLLWRWLTSLALWGVLRLLWPRQPEPALWASLLFTVYPGFQQQSIALLYSHFEIVLTAFLASLACSLLALKYPRWRFLLLSGGMLLSAINLLMLEYFFLLELLRPVLLWLALGEQSEGGQRFAAPEGGQARLRRVLAAWAPYGAVLVAAVVWRVFLFPYQTNNYRLDTLQQFSAQPLQTLGLLAWRVLEQIWIATGLAWVAATRPPNADMVGEVNIQRYLIIMAASAAGLWVTGMLLGSAGKLERRAQRSAVPAGGQRQWIKEIGVLALLALGLAGWPFWLTNVPFSLAFAYDRFTLPFMLGASLLLTGLIALLPGRALRWLALAGLVGLGIGFQYQTGLAYRQDWVYQQEFFWQLKARVPNLKPGTLIIANENPVTAYSTDNSLTSVINWIYDPHNRSQNIQYLLLYPTIRAGNENLKLVQDSPVTEDLLIGKFNGNTRQSITIFYNGMYCLHVVDPVLDALNPAPPDLLKHTAQFSDFSLIQPLANGQTEQTPPLPSGSHLPLRAPEAGAGPRSAGDEALPAILGQAPRASWCNLYQKADLLRQLAQWYNIMQLWDAQGKDLFPQSRFPAEAAPFVEAYARSGQWEQAVRLSVNTMTARPVFCALWQQLDRTTASDPGKAPAVRAAFDTLKCSEYGIFLIQP